MYMCMKLLVCVLVSFLLVAGCACGNCKEDASREERKYWCLSKADLQFRPIDGVAATPLITDLIDAYNGCMLLNSIWCDFELWDRCRVWGDTGIAELDCSILSDDSIRSAAVVYQQSILALFSDTLEYPQDSLVFDRGYDAFRTFKEILFTRYHVRNYGDLSEETYWENYDKAKHIPDYDSIFVFRFDKNEENAIRLKSMIESETDFDRKCIYVIEYAHCKKWTYETMADVQDRFVDIMKAGEYSIYLYECWRTWRCLYQSSEGASKDSYIPNAAYCCMKRICAQVILKHIADNPFDLMAINQFLMLSAADNIYRYGIFPYGNQGVIEEMNIFSEDYE